MQVTYNLAAEVAALLLLTLLIIGFLLDHTLTTTKHRVFRWLCFSSFASTMATILAVYTLDHLDFVPISLVIFCRYLFYLMMPMAAIAALYYAISLVYTKTNSDNLVRQHFWGMIPFVVYAFIIVSNIWNANIFEITAQDGIIEGPFYRITYIIVVLYFILAIGFIYKNRHSPRRNSLLIICLNLIVTAVVFCVQLVMPRVQMSGLASVLGIMVIYIYIQNTTKLTDELTELSNRQALTIQLNQLCAKKRPFSLYVFSLRNFKGINERLGLEYGDALLEAIAFRLRQQAAFKMLFRYTGDEFALLAEEGDEYDSTLKDLLLEPYQLGENLVKPDMISARVDYPAFGVHAKEIISAVDYSIASLKKLQGETDFFYDLAVCDAMKHRNDIIEQLKFAIDNNGFEPYYQPIYDVNTGEFSMAEALIRLKNSNIGPAEFIPVAEETGQIIKITFLMLNMVCSDFRTLLNKYGDALPLKSISVNVPYAQFLSKDVANQISEILSQYHFSNDQIQIELTERTLSSDINGTKKVVDEMAEKGFVFELDDFGVEYSNLSMFFDMPIHIVKFDRSLVLNFTKDKSRREFFKTFLSAVKATNMKAIMEGVEDEELLQFLMDCGSDYIQGYVFSKPLPMHNFEEFLIKHK